MRIPAIAALLIVTVASIAVAQQPAAMQAEAAPVAAAPPVEQSAPAGPRVRTDLQTVEPSFSADKAAMHLHKQTHTIVFSTLVLVLAIVIIVLLVAK